MTLRWKDIPGYEGLYQIASNGRVFSLRKNKCLTPNLSGNHGYPYVHLYRDGCEKACLIHRLLAVAFIPNPKGLPVVDHRNRIPTDNRLRNLRWATQSLNQHNLAVRATSRSKCNGVKWHKGGNKWCVSLGNKYIGLYSDLVAAILARKRAEVNYRRRVLSSYPILA